MILDYHYIYTGGHVLWHNVIVNVCVDFVSLKWIFLFPTVFEQLTNVGVKWVASKGLRFLNGIVVSSAKVPRVEFSGIGRKYNILGKIYLSVELLSKFIVFTLIWKVLFSRYDFSYHKELITYNIEEIWNL